MKKNIIDKHQRGGRIMPPWYSGAPRTAPTLAENQQDTIDQDTLEEEESPFADIKAEAASKSLSTTYKDSPFGDIKKEAQARAKVQEPGFGVRLTPQQQANQKAGIGINAVDPFADIKLKPGETMEDAQRRVYEEELAKLTPNQRHFVQSPPERQQDLIKLQKSVALPANTNMAKIQFIDYNPKSGAAPVSPEDVNKAAARSKARVAILEDGTEFIFTDNLTTSDWQENIGTTAAAALAGGITYMFEFANNLSRKLLAADLIEQEIFGWKPDPDREREGLAFSPWTQAAKEQIKKDKIHRTPGASDEATEAKIKEYEATGKSGLLFQSFWWDKVFSEQYANNEVLQAAETGLEFMVPGAALSKAGLVTKVMKQASKAGALSKYKNAAEILDKVGFTGDMLGSAMYMGAAEAVVEGRDGAANVAMQHYNKARKAGVLTTTMNQEGVLEDSMGPEPIMSYEDLLKEPESQAKQEALRVYDEAYHGIFNKNFVMLSMLNVIPLSSIMGGAILRESTTKLGQTLAKTSGTLGRTMANFKLQNPIISGTLEVSVNAFGEGTQEVIQGGIGDYEMNKHMYGAYGDIDGAGVWGELATSAEIGFGKLGKEANTTSSFLLGIGTSTVMVTPSEAATALRQWNNLEEVNKLMKTFPASDLSSIGDVFKGGKVNTEELAKRVNGLNSMVLNEQFMEAAKKMKSPELQDYAYTQSIGKLVYDAAAAKMDKPTVEAQFRSILNKHTSKNQTYTDTNGQEISRTEFIDKRMESVALLYDSYHMTNAVAHNYNLNEKVKQGVFQAVVGRNYFAQLAEKQIETLHQIEESRRSEFFSTEDLEESFADDLYDPNDTGIPLRDITKQRNSLKRRIGSSINVIKSYNKLISKLVARDHITKMVEIARKQKAEIVKKEVTNDPANKDKTAQEIELEAQKKLIEGNPDITEEQLKKDSKEIANVVVVAKEKAIRQQAPIDAAVPGVTPEEMITPPGTRVEDWEKDIRTKVVNEQISQQEKDAEIGLPEERYLNKPLLLAKDTAIFYEFATEEEKAEINHAYTQAMGIQPGQPIPPEVQAVMDGTLPMKMKDKTFADIMAKRLTDDPTIRERPLGSRNNDENPNQGERSFDNADWTTPDAIFSDWTDPESTDTIGEKIPQTAPLTVEAQRNQNSARVAHIEGFPPGADTSENYTTSKADHDLGLAYLHLGLLGLNDIVHLEIEPGLKYNDSAYERNWTNVIIQIVIYDKNNDNQRIVIGQLAPYMEKDRKNSTTGKITKATATELLHKVRNDIYTQWIADPLTPVKTGWSTTVKEIYKGHIQKVDEGTYDRVGDMPSTAEVLKLVGKTEDDVEVGLIVGTQNEQSYVSTNNAKVNPHSNRGTLSPKTKTGFPVLLMKSHKTKSKEQYYEKFQIFTKRVRDIPGYRERIIELIAQDKKAEVHAMVNWKTGPSWGWDEERSIPILTEGNRIIAEGAEAVYNGIFDYAVDLKDGTVKMDAEGRPIKLGIDDKAIHIDVAWFKMYEGGRKMPHPFFPKGTYLKDFILEFATGSDFNKGSVNHYAYNGQEEDSFFHSAKFAVNNWSKAGEAVTEEQSKDISTEPELPLPTTGRQPKRRNVKPDTEGVAIKSSMPSTKAELAQEIANVKKEIALYEVDTATSGSKSKKNDPQVKALKSKLKVLEKEAAKFPANTVPDVVPDMQTTATIFGEAVTPAQLAKVQAKVAEIIANSEFIKLDETGSFYVNIKTGKQYDRVSDIIKDTKPEESALITSATTIGTKIDTVVRDFFAGKLKPLNQYDVTEVKELTQFVESLKQIKAIFDARGEKVLANDIVLYNDELGIAGTVDLLTYDAQGNFNIYDMKTMRGNNFEASPYGTRYDSTAVFAPTGEVKENGEPKYKVVPGATQDSKRMMHTKQLSLYRILLNNTHGVLAKNIAVIPIQVAYTAGDTTTKTVKLLSRNPEINTIDYQRQIEPSWEGVQLRPMDEVEKAKIIPQDKETAPETSGADTTRQRTPKRRNVSDSREKVTTIPQGKVPKIVYEDRAASEKWLKDRLEEIDIIVSDEEIARIHKLLGLEQSSRVWGRARGAVITLAQERLIGTARHEAFHVVFNLFLTPQEREIAYAEAKVKYKDKLGSLDKFYSDKDLNTQLEEYMAEDFEKFKEQDRAPEELSKRFPKLAKILNALYRFLFARYDVYRQYFDDRRSIDDIFRQIENNSIGRNFLGQRKQSIKTLIDENIVNLENKLNDGAMYKITLVDAASVPQYLNYVNKEVMNTVLSELTDIKRANDPNAGEVKLFEHVYDIDMAKVRANLVKVYAEVKAIIKGEHIAGLELQLAEATTDQERQTIIKSIESYKILHDLISLDFISGKAVDRSTQIKQESVDFTKRLLTGLEESQGLIFTDKAIVSSEQRRQEVMAQEADEESLDETIASLLNMEDENGITSQNSDTYERWQLDFIMEKSYDRLTPKLKSAISGIPARLPKKEGQVIGDIEENHLGMIVYHNSRLIYDILVEKIASSYTVQEMKNKLEALKDKDYRIDAVISELVKDPDLITDLWIGIGNKYNVGQLINLSSPRGIKIFPSNTKEVVKQITNKFIANFQFMNWDKQSNSRLDKLGDIPFTRFKELIEDKPNDDEQKTQDLPDLLSNLGFFISDKARDYLLNDIDAVDRNNIYDNIRYIVGKIEKNINPTIFTDNSGRGGAKSKIRNIAQILRTSDPTIDMKMFTNGKQKLVSGHILAGYFVKEFRRIKTDILDNKDKKSRRAAVADFVERTDFIFERKAPIVSWIENERPIGAKFYIMDSRKRGNQKEGKEITDMTEKQMHVNRFEFWLGGLNQQDNPGGKENKEYSFDQNNFKTTWYQLAVPDSGTTYFYEFPVLETLSDIFTQLSSVFEQEKERVDHVKDLLSRGESTGDANLDENGQVYHFLPGLEKFNPQNWSQARERLFNKDAANMGTYAFVEGDGILQRGFKDYVHKMKENGLLTIEKNQKTGEEFLVPMGQMPETMKFGSFSKTLELYWYNDFLMNTQAMTMLAGDPAGYTKNKDNNLTSIDWQKRIKAYHANGIYGNFEEPTFNAQYVYDEFQPSTDEFLAKIDKLMTKAGITDRNLIDKTIAAHKNVNKGKGHNLSDAQGYVTLERWRAIKKSIGEWNPRMDEAFARLKDGTANKLDIVYVTQPLKPHYFGPNPKGELNPRLLLKYSAIVLHPGLTKDNKKLAALQERMEVDNMDEVIYESGVKTGKTQLLTLDNYIANGSVEVNADGTVKLDAAGIPTQTKQVLTNQYYKEQQKVPEHFLGKQKILAGIQFRKIAPTNANLTGVYTENETLANTYRTFFPEAMKGEKDHKMTGSELIKLLDYLMAENILAERSELLDEINDFNNFIAVLTTGVENKSLGSQYKDALEIINRDGVLETRVSLANPIVSRKLEEITNSLFRKVSKQMHNGSSFVNASSVGFSDELNIVEENGKFIVEVAMPYDAKTLGYNVETSELEKIREGVVYRIPTEEKYSIFPIRVVKWLDPSAGGVIFMPKEVTTIAGLDFDIDKVYAMLYNYESYNGKIKSVTRDFSTRAGKENLMLDIYMALLTDANTFKDFIQPQDIQPLKDIRTDIFKKAGKTLSTAIPISFTQSQVGFIANNNAGKNLIGIFANLSSFHSLAQNAGAFITEDAVKKLFTGSLAHYQEESMARYTSLSRETDFNGNLISRSIAMLISAATDNAKDPVLNDLNINVFTAPMVGLLVQLGIPINEAVARINEQDVIDAYKEFESGANNIDSIKSQEVKALYNMGKSLSRAISSLRIDAGTGPTLHDVDKKIQDIIKTTTNSPIKLSNMLPSIDTVIKTRTDLYGKEETYEEYIISPTSSKEVPRSITQYVQILLDEANFARQHWPYFNERFSKVKNTLGSYATHPYGMSASNRRLADVEHIGILHYDLFKIQDPVKFILAFPNQYMLFANDYLSKTDVAKKYALLFSVFSPDPTTGLLTLTDKSAIDPDTQDVIKQQWESALKSMDPAINEMANELIKYAFMTTGYKYTMNSFTYLVPPSFFEDNPEFRNFENRHGIPEEIIALHIAMNDPDKFLPMLQYGYDPTKNPRKLIKGTTETEEGEVVDTYAPMYASFIQKQDRDPDQMNEAYIIFMADQFVDSVFDPNVPVTEPVYSRIVWKDPNIKGRTYNFNLDLSKPVLHDPSLLSKDTSSTGKIGDYSEFDATDETDAIDNAFIDENTEDMIDDMMDNPWEDEAKQPLQAVYTREDIIQLLKTKYPDYVVGNTDVDVKDC